MQRLEGGVQMEREHQTEQGRVNFYAWTGERVEGMDLGKAESLTGRGW